MVQQLFSEFFLGLRTPQFMWVLGYTSFAASMWFLFLEGLHRKWRFRYTYVAGALHMTVVSVWAALIAVGSAVPRDLLNLLLSITTTLMIFGMLYGFSNKDNF